MSNVSKPSKKSVCECGLCQEFEKKENIIFEFKYTFFMFNRYPYLPGHIMLVPKRIVSCVSDLNSEEKMELINNIALGQDLLYTALHDTLQVTSTNVGINTGPDSGASIPGHLHVHIVPRRHRDTNFMHTCTFSGTASHGHNDPIMYKGMYNNARKWILQVVEEWISTGKLHGMNFKEKYE
jgi:ATP adenylyltransferase